MGGTNIATTILFVYGTLKRGLRNHHRLSDQEFLGEAVTEARYRVIDLGPYPGLIVDAVNGLAVPGELWAVNERSLAELDAFENVPVLFTRDPITIAGREGVVYAYFMNTPLPANAASGDRWPLKNG
ncbi:MAG: gamma-glutamylcyclotransferase [Planctomycetaceae bacterium]|nr:gamma-glutamylcyclotransferase [Planctomycetaceae bacterium]